MWAQKGEITIKTDIEICEMDAEEAEVILPEHNYVKVLATAPKCKVEKSEPVKQTPTKLLRVTEIVRKLPTNITVKKVEKPLQKLEIMRVQNDLDEVKRILNTFDNPNNVEGEIYEEELDILLQLQESLEKAEALIKAKSPPVPKRKPPIKPRNIAKPSTVTKIRTPEEKDNAESLLALCDIKEENEEVIFEEVELLEYFDEDLPEENPKPRKGLEAAKLKNKPPQLSRAKQKAQDKYLEGKCCGCEEKFETFDELKEHALSVHQVPVEKPDDSDVKIWVCTICYKVFEGYDYFSQGHNKNQFKKRLILINIPCCTCEVSFDTMEELREHSEIVHSQNRYENPDGTRHECDICYKSYNDSKTLWRHKGRMLRRRRQLRDAHDKVTSKVHVSDPTKTNNYEIEETTESRCCGCKEVFETKDEMMAHSKVYHEICKLLVIDESRPHECNVCFRYFPLKTTLMLHQSLPYMVKKFICSICGLGFPLQNKLKQHEDTKHAEKVVCNKCEPPKIVASMSALKSHMRVVHPAQRYVCPTCGKLSATKEHHTSHLTIHEDDKLYGCTLCSKKFKRRNLVKVHMRVHTGEKPFSCQYCTKSFSHWSDNKRHEMSHTGEYPYSCKFCAKNFARKTHWEQHENSHEKV